MCCTKSDGIVKHITVTRGLKKFRWGCKNLDDRISCIQPKGVDSKAMFQAIKINPAITIQRVSGEFRFHNPICFIIVMTPAKTPNIQTMSHITKIFWLIPVFRAIYLWSSTGDWLSYIDSLPIHKRCRFQCYENRSFWEKIDWKFL